MIGDDWKPKLGEVLSEQGQPDNKATRRFRDAGFDLHLTLQEQSPADRGDKNNEGNHPPLSRRMIMAETESHESASHKSAPKEMMEAAERMRQAGMTVGFPVVMQVDEKLLTVLKGGPAPMPIGQDLARFAGKAAIAGVIGLGAAVTYHYITKPPVIDGMA